MSEKKMIILSDNEIKLMSFEEVKEEFMPIVIAQVKKANLKFFYNKTEEEDFLQELLLELWRAYKQYNPCLGNQFSTYLYYKILKGVRNVTFKKFSLKNKNNGVISLNAPLKENDNKEYSTLEEMLYDDKETAQELLEYKELCLLIKKYIVSDEDKELLSVLLNKKNHSIKYYAEKYGITRQAANQRVNKFKNKLKDIIIKEYLLN